MIQLFVKQDDFYTNPDLSREANGTVTPLIYCRVSDEWYNENKGSLLNSFEAEDDGNN